MERSNSLEMYCRYYIWIRVYICETIFNIRLNISVYYNFHLNFTILGLIQTYNSINFFSNLRCYLDNNLWPLIELITLQTCQISLILRKWQTYSRWVREVHLDDLWNDFHNFYEFWITLYKFVNVFLAFEICWICFE